MHWNNSCRKQQRSSAVKPFGCPFHGCYSPLLTACVSIGRADYSQVFLSITWSQGAATEFQDLMSKLESPRPPPLPRAPKAAWPDHSALDGNRELAALAFVAIATSQSR
jgi:hypothetical protein